MHLLEIKSILPVRPSTMLTDPATTLLKCEVNSENNWN